MKLSEATYYNLGANNVCLALQSDNQTSFYNSSNLTIAIPLTGTQKLEKYGSGNLALSGIKTYTGGTFLNRGALSITNAATISSGDVTFRGGKLQLSSSSTNYDFAPNIKNSTSPVNIEIGSGSSANVGLLDSSNTGGIYRTATSNTLSGSLTFLGSVSSHGISGPFVIETLSGIGFTTTLRSSFPNISSVNFKTGSGLGSTSILILSDGGSLGTSATPFNINLNSGASLPDGLTISPSISTKTFSNPIYIDTNFGRGQIATTGSKGVDLNSTINIAGSGVGEVILSNNSTAGVNSTLSCTGSIIGASEFNNNFSLRGSVNQLGIFTATIILTGGSTTGITINGQTSWTIFPNLFSRYNKIQISTIAPLGSASPVKWGGNNAIDPKARMEFGTSGSGNPYDLNGYNQTIAGLVATVPTISGVPDPIIVGTREYNIITNNGGSASTITLSGLNGTKSLYGLIKDGTSKINIIHNSSTRQNINGVHLYTGYTAISAGSFGVGSLVSGASSKFGGAVFTPTTLTVTFSASNPPAVGETYTFFSGPTINTYATVTLVNAPGRTGSYNSSTSTLTIA